MRPNTPALFWSRVQQSPDAESCWIWLSGRGRGGYGKAKYQGRTWSAHRLAYTLAKGPIPSGKQINHSCDNRLCCNPSHLSAGTQKENIARAVRMGRMASGFRNGSRLHPDAVPRGERNGSAKLKAYQVREIRSRVDSPAQLAAEYGVSIPLIQKIKGGRLWRHLNQQQEQLSSAPATEASSSESPRIPAVT